jgi:hypothetical protein
MASMDGIIDTVSATHPIPPLLGLLKPKCTMILVGAPEKPLEIPAFALLFGMYFLHFTPNFLILHSTFILVCLILGMLNLQVN